jgi:pimeloyl-ACP methyl ester carboxylesterase
VRRLAARSFDRAYHPSGVRRQLVAIWTSGNRRPALAALRLPTLVFHGAADPLIPVENGRGTAAAIPGARLEIVDGMGHELPRRVWPRLVEAIARQLTDRSK